MEIIINRGKKSAFIKIDKHDTYLGACRNGFQTTSFPVDKDIIEMLKECIEIYLKQEN